ncbi:hypothetical protein [Pseudolactococcus paracarnosus]|uniref:hypothetical protein n=1 Tax=Pseudolactococcus paracarnosus TaxID=2749962 RepID=UPI001FBB711B|nr:hypothetical protein [Lactococcus paracarnosus]MCJ1998487.1 hypothetical protein [Lactococcus paracarnosus]
MKYIAKLGNQYIIEDFSDEVELRLDHVQKLPCNSITKIGRDTVLIDTTLTYKIGQGVSIGGFETGGKYFRLLEVSITDYPVFPDAEIIGIAQEQQSKYELLVI